MIQLLTLGQFSSNVLGVVTKWDDINRYGYNPYGLFIPYILSLVFTYLTVMVGLISFHRTDGGYPDKKIQDFVLASQAPGVGEAFKNKRSSITGKLDNGSFILEPGGHHTYDSNDGHVHHRVHSFV